MTKGIDISEHNGSGINFEKVKKEVDYVIIRAGFGNVLSYPQQKDKCFEVNYKGCKEQDIPCGVYFYSYAKNVAEAEREADSCISLIKGKKFEYPIYYDLEESSQFALGKSMCSNMVKAFCNKLENAGYYAGLYISRSPLQQFISDDVANRYALWVAEYGDKCNYDGNYGAWQYSSSGKISGISGYVDLDYCYVDYPSAIKKAGLNGYEKAPDKKVLDTSGYKKGDKTIGVLSFKCLLLTAKKLGIVAQSVDCNQVFGDGTQKAVNEMLGKWGYKQTGCAGENFIEKLYGEIDKKL